MAIANSYRATQRGRLSPESSRAAEAPRGIARDPAERERYLEAALSQIPRLLGAIDRNPFRPTYGCLDRQFWHYRTSDFPSEMYQEGALPLALVYALPLPGNRWHGCPRTRDLAIAAIRFAAKSSHSDGSCDDYYPFERALGAAVFSLAATSEAYRLLKLDDAELRAWFERRARWLIRHDESGRLANHQALAALGLARAARITGDESYSRAAERRIQKVLSWQSAEGWFEEYGGADPGYQTVTIDCLAKYRKLTGATNLDEPIARATAFARHFLHPDDSYAGEYGSRGTYHFYPHGMELLAGDDAAAADLADGFLRSLAAGKQAWFDDDRLVAHRLGNLIEAYRDWSPLRPPESVKPPSTQYFAHARLLVRKSSQAHTVVSAARGGVFKHFSRNRPAVTDCGLIVEVSDGHTAVSQSHDLTRAVEQVGGEEGTILTVSGPLHLARFETLTPLKLVLFRAGLLTFGRVGRSLVRRLLQRRLITGRRECPVRLTRKVELMEMAHSPMLRVTDLIELTSRRVTVRRMSIGTDHQAAYVAATGVYQDSVLAPWTELAGHVARLNADRAVTIVREFP